MAVDSGSRQSVLRSWSLSTGQRSRCMGLLLIAVLQIVFSGCTTAKAPIDHLAFCTPDPRLLGTWHRRKSGQFGSAAMWFSFGCDCRYKTLIRFIFVNRHHEEGSYSVDGDWIELTHANGAKTLWKVSFDEGRLLLVEEGEEGEVHQYTRVEEKDCPVEPKM